MLKNEDKQFFAFLLHYIKMEKWDLIFGEVIIKNKFHIYEKSVSIDKLDINRIIFLKKESYHNEGSYKYFIGYILESFVFPSLLCIKSSQMNASVKYFDKNTKYMNFLGNDEEILENTIKYGMKLKIYLIKILIVNRFIMINKN